LYYSSALLPIRYITLDNKNKLKKEKCLAYRLIQKLHVSENSFRSKTTKLCVALSSFIYTDSFKIARILSVETTFDTDQKNN